MRRPTFYLWLSDSDRYRLLSGHGASKWLSRNGIPAMWSTTHRGYHVRAERIPDLRAMAEAEGIRVVDKGVMR